MPEDGSSTPATPYTETKSALRSQTLPFIAPKTLKAFYDFETAAYHAMS